MQIKVIKTPDRKPISKLSVVRNFKRVMESRDMSLMKRELYGFLNLYCGFIAHYDINGFKATYWAPVDFAGVFIRHFDREHRYFNGVYSCDEKPYKETGYTRAEIKREFHRIVEIHKGSIIKWAENRQRDERYATYMFLKKEFQGELKGMKINCEACKIEYEVKVLKQGEELNDFGVVCCLFCGQQIKFW